MDGRIHQEPLRQTAGLQSKRKLGILLKRIFFLVTPEIVTTLTQKCRQINFVPFFLKYSSIFQLREFVTSNRFFFQNPKKHADPANAKLIQKGAGVLLYSLALMRVFQARGAPMIQELATAPFLGNPDYLAGEVKHLDGKLTEKVISRHMEDEKRSMYEYINKIFCSCCFFFSVTRPQKLLFSPPTTTIPNRIK